MTMQNVAWPMTIVHSESLTPVNAKNEFSAMPVMRPGRAIGSTSRNDTTSRPKKRNPCTANAAAEPRMRAAPVARSPAFNDSSNDDRTSESCHAPLNHLSERWEIGQLWMFDL